MTDHPFSPRHCLAEEGFFLEPLPRWFRLDFIPLLTNTEPFGSVFLVFGLSRVLGLGLWSNICTDSGCLAFIFIFCFYFFFLPLFLLFLFLLSVSTAVVFVSHLLFVCVCVDSFECFQGPFMWLTLGKKKTFNFWIKDGKMFQLLDFCSWARDVTIDRLICDKHLMTVNPAHSWIQKKNQIE